MSKDRRKRDLEEIALVLEVGIVLRAVYKLLSRLAKGGAAK